jgi:hypothetical protein
MSVAQGAFVLPFDASGSRPTVCHASPTDMVEKSRFLVFLDHGRLNFFDYERG